MQLKSLLPFLCLAFLFLYSCGGSGSDDPKVDAAYKSVMAVHDEVMPEMGTIHRLRKKLKAKVKEGMENDSIQTTAMTQMISELDAADEGMMSWMADFKMPKDVTTEEQLSYLKKEQAKIDQVSKDMFGRIESAKKLLEME